MPDYVPYEPNLGPLVLTRCKRLTLSTGAEIMVGRQDDHPEGVIMLHHVTSGVQADGQRTKLVFALTPEACRALVTLYAAHGISKLDAEKQES